MVGNPFGRRLTDSATMGFCGHSFLRANPCCRGGGGCWSVAPAFPDGPAMSLPYRRSFVEIDLSAIAHNVRVIAEAMSPAGVIAVVKADAYGHGATAVARAAMKAGAWGLAVATTDEGLALRALPEFRDVRIIVLAPTLADEAAALQGAHLDVIVGNLPLLQHHLALARDRREPARLHIQMDTGIGRDGFRFDDLSWLEAFAPGDPSFAGLMAHFSCSDGLSESDSQFTHLQQERFEEIRRTVVAAGHRPLIHTANSGAILRHRWVAGDLVRPGMMLYGVDPAGTLDPPLPLRPVLTLKSRLGAVRWVKAGDSVSYGRTWTAQRDTLIGVVPLGYGDGFPRLFSSKGMVLVHGRRVPIRGRVCMDQFMVDLSEVPDARDGDEVVVYGRQGDERLSLEEMAAIAGTIPYELTCFLTARVPRQWHGAE
ncbi:alanine racemase [bacterium]|nr:alanine racemase [bacterium]